MSKNGFGLDASDRENCALRMAPASLQNFWQTGRAQRSAFRGRFWGRPGIPPTIGRKLARSPMSYVSIAAVKIRFWWLFQDRQTDWQTDRLTDWLREREEWRDSQPLTATHHQARTLAAALNFVAPGDASHVAEPLLQACALGPETYGRYITAATEV